MELPFHIWPEWGSIGGFPHNISRTGNKMSAFLIFFSSIISPLYLVVVNCQNRKHQKYLCTPAMGRSTDPFHYRQRYFVLLSYKSLLYKNRQRCCQGLSYCSTPAQWIQWRGDVRTRSLQWIIKHAPRLMQPCSFESRNDPECNFNFTLTDHTGFLPLSRSGTDGYVSLPNVVISIVTLIKHLSTHPGALIPQRVSVREVRGRATVNLWGPKSGSIKLYSAQFSRSQECAVKLLTETL